MWKCINHASSTDNMQHSFGATSDTLEICSFRDRLQRREIGHLRACDPLPKKRLMSHRLISHTQTEASSSMQPQQPTRPNYSTPIITFASFPVAYSSPVTKGPGPNESWSSTSFKYLRHTKQHTYCGGISLRACCSLDHNSNPPNLRLGCLNARVTFIGIDCSIMLAI